MTAKRNLKPERIRMAKAAEILGVTLRTAQDMAARGDIPSAAKIGKVWTFNELVVRRWVRQKEGEAACRAISTSEAESGGPASKSEDGKYEKAYERNVWTKPDAA